MILRLWNIGGIGYNKAIVLELIKAIKGGIPMKIASAINKCSSMKDIERMFSDVKQIPEMSKIYHELEKGQFHFAIPKIAMMLETPKKTKDQIEH